jgi:hypothetical protein
MTYKQTVVEMMKVLSNDELSDRTAAAGAMILGAERLSLDLGLPLGPQLEKIK